MTGGTSGVCGQLWATLGVTKVEKCQGAMPWKCRSDVSARLSSRHRWGMVHFCGEVIELQCYQGGWRSDELSQKVIGATDADRRLSLPEEEINDNSKVDRAGKLQIGQENLNWFCCYFDAITNPISHHWKSQYSYRMLSPSFYWSKNRFQKPSSARKAPQCVNIWNNSIHQKCQNISKTLKRTTN